MRNLKIIKKAIDDWMRGLRYPDSVAEYGSWIARDPLSENIPVDPNISDGTLLIYNSNFRVNTKVKFRGLFPVSLSTISFGNDQVDVEYVVAEARSNIEFLTLNLMNLEMIQDLWEKDSKIDETNLHSESTKIPSLHSKYYKLYNNILVLKKAQENKTQNFKEEEKWQYYTGEANLMYTQNTLLILKF